MQLRNNLKLEKNDSWSILSATPRPTQTKITTAKKPSIAYKTITRQILEVYVDENGHTFVKKSAYHALFSGIRAIMVDSSDELVPLPIGALQKLSDKHYDIRYIKLEAKKEKQKIVVYTDESGKSIDMSAAFALNLVSEGEFMTSGKRDKYYLNENLMAFISNNYDAEYINIKSTEDNKTR